MLKPRSQNFYQQAELFPVFAQHANTPEGLAQLNGQQQGALSFANPDNPVVTSPLRTPPPLAPGQSVLIARPNVDQHSGNTRKPLANTTVHHASCWPLVQTLQQLKKQAAPNNRLRALRLALQAEHTGDYVQHPQPEWMATNNNCMGFKQ